MTYFIVREKLHEAQDELQKKNEFIEDLEHDVQQKCKYRK